MEHHSISRAGSDVSLYTYLIDRYCAGEASAEDMAALEALFREHPELRASVEEIQAEFAISKIPSVTTTELAQIRDTILAGSSTRPSASRSVGIRTALQWAAGIAVVCVAVIGVFVSNRLTHSALRGQVYATRVAQQATVTLRDGTKIVLAPQTRLTVAPEFGTSTRTVAISGEAWFNVPSAAGAPFVVRTGRVSVRVLGTTFGVRQYVGERATQVTVRSGKVLTNTHGRSVILIAGRVAQVTDSTTQVGAIGQLESNTDWTRGLLVFSHTPVSELLVSVGRWYGYQFRLTDSSLTTKRISATFKVSEPAEMMAMLKAVLDVNMSFDGNVVTLVPRHNANPTARTRARQTILTPTLEAGR